MPAWGYRGWTGEILAYNYELSDMVTYRYGCAPGVTASAADLAARRPSCRQRPRRPSVSGSTHPATTRSCSATTTGSGAARGAAPARPSTATGGSFYACVFAKGGPSGRVDTRRPTVGAVAVDGAILAAASDANARAGASVRLTATLADADALGRVAGWRVAVDGRDVVDEHGAGRVDTGGGSVAVSTTLDTPGLAAGPHVIAIRARPWRVGGRSRGPLLSSSRRSCRPAAPAPRTPHRR